MGGSYKPATEEAIHRYQNEEYPRWLSECESLLSNLHSTLQEQEPLPYFEVTASNVGTKPARDVLITFTAQGSFQISVESDYDTSISDEQLENPISFPEPPQAPAGGWLWPFGDINAMANMVSNLQHSIMAPLPG